MESLSGLSLFPWDQVVYFESYYRLSAEQREVIRRAISLHTQRPYRVIEEVQGL